MIPLPETFERLYYGQDRRAKNFRKYINSFNNAFCMTSSGMKRHMPGGSGPPVYTVQGVPYHQHGALQTRENQNPLFAQVYLVDIAEAIDNRIRQQKLKYFKSAEAKRTMKELSEYLHTHNAFVKKYKTAVEIQDNETDNLCLIFGEKKNTVIEHPRVWNAPIHGGIGGLIKDIDEIEWKDRYRDVVIRIRGSGRLQGICEVNRLYDPLHYVLLFPTGTNLYFKP